MDNFEGLRPVDDDLGTTLLSACEFAVDTVGTNGMERDDAIMECALAALEAMQQGLDGLTAAVDRAWELKAGKGK